MTGQDHRETRGGLKTQRLRPLTAPEQKVAAHNCGIIDRFLSKNRLPAAEWYDVVVFGYLLAVEKWFSRPELCRYCFSTIAWSSMLTCVGNERRAQERRIKAVSLDDIIPGTDGLTYADIITEDNLNFTIYA